MPQTNLQRRDENLSLRTTVSQTTILTNAQQTVVRNLQHQKTLLMRRTLRAFKARAELSEHLELEPEHILREWHHGFQELAVRLALGHHAEVLQLCPDLRGARSEAGHTVWGYICGAVR